MFQRYTDLPSIKALYSKATPTEKGQIVAFIKANTEGRLGATGIFTLIRMTAVGSGREFTTVSMLLEGKGVTANQIREVVGLGKTIPAKAEPKPTPTRKKLIGRK